MRSMFSKSATSLTACQTGASATGESTKVNTRAAGAMARCVHKAVAATACHDRISSAPHRCDLILDLQG
jgi:hypothetical protein